MKNSYKLLYQSFEIMNLLLNKNEPIGGAAVEWYTWLKGFKQIGANVGVLTWAGANNQVKNKEFDFDLVESYDLEKGLPKLRLFSYRIPEFYKAIKKYNPDFVLQACATEYTGVLALISKLLNKPFVHRIGSDMDVDGRIDRTFSKLSLTAYYFGIKNASHISCQNQYQYDILKKKYPKKSISILYNPFEAKNVLETNNNKNYIAWIGNFRYEKNLPALAKVAAALPTYNFKIAGTKFNKTDGDTVKGIEHLEKLNNVEFLGHLGNENISTFLSNSYCLLNTSRLEGFSNTFLEAWAAGVPVVTTANVNPDNLIKKYNLGIVVDDYESIPKNLVDLIPNKKYLDYRERCRNYVLEMHDPQKLAKDFLTDMIRAKG